MLSVILDAARIRNFASLNINAFYLAAFGAGYSGRVILLSLEQVHKSRWLQPEFTKRKLSREVTAGFFERVTVFWFIKDLIAGWKTTLRLEDLGMIDIRDRDEQYATFQLAWDKSSRCKAPLLKTIWRFAGVSSVEPLVPGLPFFTFCVLRLMFSDSTTYVFVYCRKSSTTQCNSTFHGILAH